MHFNLRVMKKLLLALVFLAPTLGAIAQSSLRKEIKLTKDLNNLNIIPVGENGVLLMYETNEKSKGKSTWFFTLYGQTFKEKWTEPVVIIKNFEYRKHQLSENGNLHVLFTDNKFGEYFYVIVDSKRKDIKTFGGAIPIKAEPSFFTLIGENAFFGGTSSISKKQACGALCCAYTCVGIFIADPLKTHATLNYVDTDAKRLKPIVLQYSRESRVNDISASTDGNQINSIIEHEAKRNVNRLYLASYDQRGKEEFKSQIDPSRTNTRLIDGLVYNIGEDARFIVGTYNNRPKTKTLTIGENLSNIAIGFYFTEFQGRRQRKIHYYPFSEFENFWGDISKKSEERIKKNKAKAKKKGKSLSIGYRILPNKIVQRNGELVYIGEAYYPTYRTETYTTTTTTNGVTTTTTNTRQVFDGWRFTHGLVAGFSLEGDLKWEKSFTIGTKSFSLTPKIKIFGDDQAEDLVMVYQEDNELKSQVLSGNNLKVKKESITITPSKEYEKLKGTYQQNIEHWYGNNFVTYGYQRVVDKDKRLGKRRETIFYFNKISYE